MNTMTSIVIVLLIVVLLVVPIIPQESCIETTKNVDTLGITIARRVDTTCSPTTTSVLGIFLKGLEK